MNTNESRTALLNAHKEAMQEAQASIEEIGREALAPFSSHSGTGRTSGTDGSNPASSIGESANFQSLGRSKCSKSCYRTGAGPSARLRGPPGAHCRPRDPPLIGEAGRCFVAKALGCCPKYPFDFRHQVTCIERFLEDRV